MQNEQDGARAPAGETAGGRVDGRGATDGVKPRRHIDPDKIQVAHFAPPPALAPYVTQLYHFRCDELHIQDMQPAALGHLIFLFQGDGHLKFADGHIDTIHPVTLFGPGGAAAEFSFSGPLEHFGMALSPLGFAALTGKPASQYADRAVAASELLGPEIDSLARQIREQRQSGALTFGDMVEKLTAFLISHMKPVPPAHIAVIKHVLAWISSNLEPDVDDLYTQLQMSRSTASRLVTRYFGSAPKPLMRKYRALRAASILIDRSTSSEVRARIESSFYDQPHMIREIRQFTGRTPGALDGDDVRILRIWLSRDNYRMLDCYPG